MKTQKLRLLMVSTLLLLVACHTDDETPLVEQRSSQVRYVSAAEIPGIMDQVNQSLNYRAGTINSANQANTSIGAIDLNYIMEVLDSAENANYSFMVDDGDDNPMTFSNLIVRKEVNGAIHNPYLMVYEVDSTHFLESLQNGTELFENFSGRIRKINLEAEIFSGENSANLRDGKFNANTCPEEDIDVRFGDGSVISHGQGGGAGTTDSPGGLGSSSLGGGQIGECTISITYGPCQVQRDHGINEVNVPHSADAPCGAGTGTRTIIVSVDCSQEGRMNNANDGCTSEGIGEVGIHSDRSVTARFMRLDEVLERDSTKLIDIPCSELEKWRGIGGFKPPTSVVNKIADLERNYPNMRALFTGDFDILKLEEARGKVVNLDFFPVTIQRLPEGMSAESLLNTIRLNFNSFINTRYSEFIPYDLVDTDTDEEEIWNSHNPLGALIHIRIPGDEGSVICSDFSSRQWKFTTIKAPNDWDHPVSGTREFGIIRNDNGTYTFYTRGVDRITERLNEIIGERKTFNGADNLWTSLQDGVVNYIQNNRGNAVKETPVIGRPNWDEIMEYIMGYRDIDSIGCKN